LHDANTGEGEQAMKVKALLGFAVAVSSLGLATLSGSSSASAVDSALTQTGSVTVAIGAPIEVTNRLLVTLPVEVVCAAIGDSSTVPLGDLVYVTVVQAHGKSVSQAQGQLLAGPTTTSSNPNPFLTCDGSTVNEIVLSAVGTGPFHGGPAVAFAGASHTVGTCNVFCNQTEFETGSIGPIGVNVKGS
jgi:hypothetical protein